MYKTPGTDFHKVYKNNMDENSCIASKNVIATVVKNEKTTGFCSTKNGYRKTQKIRTPGPPPLI